MSSAGSWTLQLESELGVLLPWLVAERDPSRRKVLADWLRYLQLQPARGREEVPGVFSHRIWPSGPVVVWTLDHETREIILALIGEA